ncbi:hypothetical protein FACS1894170_03280 [Planctomycetales bacterium]|nr:hypothetical protein FACS1894170_03280 [Planctomycetales bacterium]
MYSTFFGLKKRPFASVPNVNAYFDIGSIPETKKTIESVIDRGESLALVFGASGTGKTLLLRMLRQSLELRCNVLPIINGLIDTPETLYQQILYNLQEVFAGKSAVELRMALLDYVRQHAALNYVLLVDEAHYLNPAVLEEIRILVSSDDEDTNCRFQAVLAGSIDFEEKLTLPRMAAFNQRVAAQCYLEPFTREETLRYIAWQMEHSLQNGIENENELSAAEAMRQNEVSEVHRIDPPHQSRNIFFSDDAVRRIHTLTDGIPRLVNQLCDKTLQIAAENQLDRIDETAVNTAWGKVQHIEILAVPESETAKSIIPMHEVDEIVAKKRETFQLRSFDSAIEFGLLEDEEQSVGDDVSRTAAKSETSPLISVYKPAYPEFDDEEQPLDNAVPEAAVIVPLATFDACSEEENMDEKTLEEYGEAVLKDRPPFVRKEPNYAYQTNDTAPEAIHSIEYPDPATGNVIVLNWQQSKDNAGHFGTAYSQRETSTSVEESAAAEQKQTPPKVCDTVKPLPQPFVERSAKQYDGLAANDTPLTLNSAIDEIFSEIQTLEQKTVPISAIYTSTNASQTADAARQTFPRSDVDTLIERRLEQVVAKITAAAEKIEQAAGVSTVAGEQIAQSAQFVETQVATAIPSYLEMFKELADFHQAVSAELNTLRLNTESSSLRSGVPQRRQIAIERNVQTIDVDSMFQ